MTGRLQCRRCLLPDTLPGLSFDASGLCGICQVTPEVAILAAERAALRDAIRAEIDAQRGQRHYDAIVAYSGGKDSSFTLKLLVQDHRLRCLALTIDNGFLSDTTYANCKAVCGTLGIDHLLFTPSRQFTEALYRASATDESLHAPASIKRASSICSSCISMINTHVLQKAIELGVWLVAGGYLGGQVPRNGGLMRVQPARQARTRKGVVERMVGGVGEQARPYFELPLPAGDADREIVIINPMLGVDLEEDEIVAALTPLGWVAPRDTGVTSTNCRLNDLGVYLHSRRHGFHPYAMEIAEQLRHGTLTREKALAKLQALPAREQVTWLAERIGLAPDAY
jgi:tRNA(Ile)-lysidine synthase TilS/MesJ